MLSTTSNPWRSVALATVAVLATFGASAAQAKTYRYTSVIQSAALSTGNGYPGPGGTAVLAGTWATDRFGDGAVVDHLTITGQPAANEISFRGTEVGFLAFGTIKDKFTGTSTVQPDGSQKIAIKGQITGGTGAYRGAKGKYKFTGSTKPGATVTTGRSAGTVSY